MSFDKNNLNPRWVFVFGFLVGILFLGLFLYFSGFKFPHSSSPTSNQSSPLAVFDIKPGDHVLGSPNAPVTLVVFNDFACPYCRQYALTLEKLVERLPKKVRVVWKHFPLNEQDMQPALASECAAEQQKFWPYAHRLYANKSEATADTKFYLSLAGQLKLDVDKFTACLNSAKYRAKVEADYYEGIAKGLLGAPSTFINGRYLPGVIPLTDLEEKVNAAVK